jgi:hypothetical protein
MTAESNPKLVVSAWLLRAPRTRFSAMLSCDKQVCEHDPPRQLYRSEGSGANEFGPQRLASRDGTHVTDIVTPPLDAGAKSQF